MSESKRLLPDPKDSPSRPGGAIENLDQRLENEEVNTNAPAISGDPPSSSSILAKIRRRQSPPYVAEYVSSIHSPTKYGTLEAGMKRSLLVDTYPRTRITKKQFAIAFVAFVIFAGAVAVTLILGLPRLDAKRSEYYAAKFPESPVEQILHHKRAVLVTGSPECARIGERILASSNSSMDAALGALFCILVTSPHLVRPDSGISGLIYQNGTGFSVQSIPSRVPLESNRTISNPWTLFQSADVLHRRFGQSLWSEILQPSIELTSRARVTESLASLLQSDRSKLSGQQNPAFRHLFLCPRTDNETLQADSPFTIPGLTETLTDLAQEGTEALLGPNGTVWTRLTRDLSRLFGSSSLNFDLKPETVNIQTPLRLDLLNGSMSMMTPAVGSGRALARALALLERLVLANDSAVELCTDDNRTLKEGTVEFHYMIEVLKFGLASLLTDDDAQNAQLTPGQLHQIVDKIVDSSRNPEAEHGLGYYGFPGESGRDWASSPAPGAQILVYDGLSDQVVALSILNANNLLDGQKILSPSTGIVLDLEEQQQQPSRPIAWSQASSPVFFIDAPHHINGARRHVRLAATATADSGSDAWQALAQVAYKILYNCQDLKSATDESRFYVEATPTTTPSQDVSYESDFPQAYIDLLAKLFAHYSLRPLPVGVTRAAAFTVYRLDPLSHRPNRNLSATPTKLNATADSADHPPFQLVSMIDSRTDEAFAAGD